MNTSAHAPAGPVVQYRQMSAEQRAAWGRAELESRKLDVLDRSVDPDGAAEARRLAIGASHRAANSMVGQAARQNRQQEAQRQREALATAALARVATACERRSQGPKYERDLTAQQQAFANVGLLEGWR